MSGELMRLTEPDVDAVVAALRAENRRLTAELADARRDVERAGAEAARAVAALRQQLAPLYRALQAIFGEMSSFADEPVGGTVRASAAWDEWKRRLGSGPARVIDALLLGGEMTNTAIAVAANMGKRTVYDATLKMHHAGILIRNGKKCSLKPLS